MWTKVLIRCRIYFKIATCSVARMQKCNNKRNRNGTTAWKMKPHIVFYTVMQVIWNWNHYGDIILPEQRCISNQQKAKDIWILSLEGTCSNMLYFVALVLGWVIETLSFILNNSEKPLENKVTPAPPYTPVFLVFLHCRVHSSCRYFYMHREMPTYFYYLKKIESVMKQAIICFCISISIIWIL